MTDIERIQPQEPTKIHISTDEIDVEANGADTLYGYCPSCDALSNSLWNERYCGDCGQRLDWSNGWERLIRGDE